MNMNRPIEITPTGIRLLDFPLREDVGALRSWTHYITPTGFIGVMALEPHHHIAGTKAIEESK